MQLKNVTLELSSKAYRDDSETTMYRVARKLFTQWKSLTDTADQVSVMLWISDGSEILEYSGDFEQKFEWAYWCGCANSMPKPQHPTERLKRHTHMYPQKYMPEAAPRSYGWLKRLIEVLREVGAEISGKPIRIGAIFDNGPEFAISDFKFHRHREIALGNSLYPGSFVVCNANLHADSRSYAAYPQGIPEGTSLGEFLGRQFKAFAHDLGYDYIWLSNGMGFGTETWGLTGMLFDKQKFYPEKADAAAQSMLRFWEDFYGAYPEVVVETRGSNFSAGTELATDAAPLGEVYRKYKIAPPVNSPWAALNFNTGLELAAWMSHIAELPDDRIPFRFYIHDPWFMNSPWLDRYAREAWDLYPPLSVGRVNENGTVDIPTSISLLSVDDTWGNMPDCVPAEVVPLFKDAFNHAPDAVGPLLWVYPFDEYIDLVRGAERNPQKVFNEELFIGEALQAGLPLNTVVSTRNFAALACKQRLAPLLKGTILVASVVAVERNIALFEQVVSSGTDLLVYGALAGASGQLLDLLGLKNSTPLDGTASVVSLLRDDRFEKGKLADKIVILPQFDDGALTEVAAGARVRVEAVQNGQKRVLASQKQEAGKGRVGFVRSITPCDENLNLNHRGFDYAAPTKVYPVERLMRHLLGEFGWSISGCAFNADTLLPRTTISRHDGAFYFSIYTPDTTSDLRISTPLGAPILTELETRLQGGEAIWRPGKSWHKECRVFVRQNEESVIRCKTGFAAFPGYSDRRHLGGLCDAEVRIFVPTGFEKTFEVVSDPSRCPDALIELTPFEWEESEYGRCAVIRHANGFLSFAW